MKKIFKLLGLLLALATVIGFTACDGLFDLGTGGEEDYSEPINHTFVRAESDTGYFVCHYDAQNTFNYGNHTNCYYQIEFTASSPKKFHLYTRKKGSFDLIEEIASGTFVGDPFRTGVVTLTTVEGKEVFKTITIQEDSNKRLYFNGDVSVTHKALNAHDAK